MVVDGNRGLFRLNPDILDLKLRHSLCDAKIITMAISETHRKNRTLIRFRGNGQLTFVKTHDLS